MTNHGGVPGPLRPVEFQILLVLAAEDAHGYGIMRETEQRTGGAVTLEAGTLYRALARLLDAAWIRESDRRPAPEADDRRRRYFAITDEGRAVAAAEASRMARLVREAGASGLLEPAEPG